MSQNPEEWTPSPLLAAAVIIGVIIVYFAAIALFKWLERTPGARPDDDQSPSRDWIWPPRR